MVTYLCLKCFISSSSIITELCKVFKYYHAVFYFYNETVSPPSASTSSGSNVTTTPVTTAAATTPGKLSTPQKTPEHDILWNHLNLWGPIFLLIRGDVIL